MTFSTLRRPVRVLLYVLLSAGTFVLILFLIFFWFVRRPFPKVRGKVELPGISEPVEILRDSDGVPHIWAASSADLYFAQGWVHAQDRAWQMEFQRRVGQGRLSEILGKKLIETDRYLRTLNFVGVAEQEYESIPDPYMEWLDAYSSGVSAYLASRPPGKLGLEFAILRLTGVKWDVEPWTPVDSLLWGKMVTMSLTGNAVHDARRLNLLRFIGRARQDDWYTPYRSDMPVTVTEEEMASFRKLLGISEPELENTLDDVAAREPVQAGGGDGAGTNVWTLAPQRTKDNHAVLVSDMHLAVNMPSIWHEIGLHVQPEPGSTESEHHVRGYSFPGIPGVVSGQNDSIAWGQSNLYGDVQDYVIEKVHPDNPNLYLVGDEWIEMDVVLEIIHVEGRNEPVVHQVRRTRHGPLVTDLERYSSLAGYSYTEEGLGVSELALNWPALRPGHLIESIFRLNRAADFKGFLEALTYWDAPSINFVYADSEGNIAYHAAGQHPLRSPEQGRIPVPGWDDSFEVAAYIPFNQLPAAYNPPKGYLVSSNNALVYREYPYYVGNEFSNGFRARRISEIVEESGSGLSFEDISSVLMDTYSLQAEETLEYFKIINLQDAYRSWLLLKESWNTDSEELDRKELRKKEKEENNELELLETALQEMDIWDRYVETDSAGAAAFQFVWKQLIILTFSDQLPDHYWPAGTGTLENAVYYLLKDPENQWWDDRRTPEIVENRDDILGRSLVTGLLEAAAEMGDKPEKWAWGDVHTVDFRNATLGESGIGPIEKIFNRGPYPIRGGNSQVHKSNWKFDDPDAPFNSTTIPSQRAIYDTYEPSNSLFMNTVGQSGHPFHRHYDDFIKPYLDGDFHPSRFTREEAEEASGGRILNLVPSGAGGEM